MRSQFASQKQIALALKLQIISRAEEGRRMTRKRISQLIKEGLERRREELQKAYERADEDIQRSGNIYDYASRLSTLKRDGQYWYSGPCPECGGVDRFYINTNDNLFKCGHASGGNGCGWAGGIVQLAAYLWKCSTWDAIDQIQGISIRKSHQPNITYSEVVPREADKSHKPNKIQTQHDLEKIAQKMWHAQNLIASPHNQQGRDYLASRRIRDETWQAFGVGFGQVWDASPAGPIWAGKWGIYFPLYASNGTLIGINRRILPLHDQDGKTRMVAGSKWGVFGLPQLVGYNDLLVIEGETNALSVWQVAHDTHLALDVLSVGSEGAFKALAQEITKIAASVERLWLWSDQSAVTECFEQMDKATRLQSPFGLDANDLLCRRALGKFLISMIPDVKQTTYEPGEAANESVIEAPDDEPATITITVEPINVPEALQGRLCRAFYQWTFAARSIKIDVKYANEAIQWAHQIKDRHLREQALRKTEELVKQWSVGVKSAKW